MSKSFTIRETIDNFFIVLLAFVLTYKAPIRYLEFHGNVGLASTIGTVSIYGVFLFSILIVIRRKDYLANAVYVFIFFGFLYLYQRIVVPTSSLGTYWQTFFINCLSGFTCGIALSKPKTLIRTAGALSFIYGILLIPEPITRALLGYTSMNLGYTMAPLTIWLILLWYFSDRFKKLILIVATALGVMTILFTSRGCGISVVAAAVIVKIIDAKKKHESISKMFIGLSIAAVVLLFAFRELASYFVLRSDITLLTGSALNKLMNGVLSDDNGRTKLLGQAIELYRQNWLLGVGMGADRQILGYVFPHNVIIEVLLHFGLAIGLLIFFSYWNPVIKAIKKAYITDIAIVIPVLCSIYWIRLLFSDSYLSNGFGLMMIFGFSIQILCKYRTGELYE